MSELKFGARAIVVAVAQVEVLAQGQVGFARVRAKAQGRLNGRVSERQPLRGVIRAEEIEAVVYLGQFAIGEEECRGARNCLIEQCRGLEQILSHPGTERR